MQIRQLLDLDHEDDIRARLGKLPTGLKDAYNEIMAKIQDEKMYGSVRSKVAIRALDWVLCSERPLSPVEVVVAACQDPETDCPNVVNIDIDFVLGACQNLIEVKTTAREFYDRMKNENVVAFTHVVTFTHLSVREYFDGLWEKSEADNLVANVCFSLLNHPDDWNWKFELDDSTGPNPSLRSWLYTGEANEPQPPKSKDFVLVSSLDATYLLPYITLNWSFHVKRCERYAGARVSA